MEWRRALPESHRIAILPALDAPRWQSLSLQWRHIEPDGVSNHRCIDHLFNRLFMRRSNKTSKLRVIGLCEGNSSVTSEFPSQRASNAKNVSIWWRHHECPRKYRIYSPVAWLIHSPIDRDGSDPIVYIFLEDFNERKCLHLEMNSIHCLYVLIYRP